MENYKKLPKPIFEETAKKFKKDLDKISEEGSPMFRTIFGEASMKKVSADEFYKTISEGDVVVSTQGNYPYTTLFKTRKGDLVAKTVDDYKGGIKNHYPLVTTYYIAT